MKAGKASHTIDIAFALALFCAFSASVLLVLMAGVKVYRDTVDIIESRYQERTCIAYISAKIRHYNSEGSIHIESFGDGDALVLSEEIDGTEYQTIIYMYNGHVTELFCEKELSFAPSDGIEIIPIKDIAFEQTDNNLIYIQCTGQDNKTAETYISILNSETEGGGQ